MKFGATKEHFLEAARWAQPGAYLGLDASRVQFTAFSEEGDSHSGEWKRTFYALDDGTVVKRLTSKGFTLATPSESTEVLAVSIPRQSRGL